MLKAHNLPEERPSGFTLIELAIVMVIIGLVLGVILVGQDLIDTATARAQISQIEKYNTAVNTFRAKFGNYLPGDMPNPPATSFGFSPRGQYAGEGDGNGVIEGVLQNAPNQNAGTQEGSGETAMFWVDLSAAQLIDGTFTAASETVVPAADITLSTTPSISAYLPQARIGKGNYIYVYSFQNVNYYGLSAVVAVGGVSGSHLLSNQNSAGSMTVAEAFYIDKKTDDGMPLTGKVLAQFVNCCGVVTDVAGSNSVEYSSQSGGPASDPLYGWYGSCYDNNGNAGVQPNYSMEQNNGSGLNCELSFQLQ